MPNAKTAAPKLPVFSLAQKNAALQRYHRSYKLPSKIDCGATSDLYSQAHKADIWDKMQADPAIKEAVEKVLALAPKATLPGQARTIADQLAYFETTIQTLNKKLKDPANNYTIGAYLAVLEEEKSTVIADIRKRHEDEIKGVKNAITQLSTSDQEKLIATLEKRQAAELAAVEKPINKALEEIHENVAARTRELTYLATMRHVEGSGNPLSRHLSGRASLQDGIQKTMEEKIAADREARNAAKPAGPVAIQGLGAPLPDFDPEDLKGITLHDVEKNLQTITGRPFTLEKAKEKEGGESCTCRVTVPGAAYNPYSIGEDFSADMRSLYEAVRVTGCDTFVVTLSHDDPEKAKEMMKIAFLEGVKAGIDPTKITIKATLGEKGERKEETFDSKQLINMVGEEKYNLAKEAGDKINKQHSNLSKKATTASSSEVVEMKKELSQMRTNAAQAQAPQPGLAAPGNP